ELVKYLDSVLATNGVRIDLSGRAVKAVSSADWERYKKDPASVALVADRLSSTFWTNLPPKNVLLGSEYLWKKRVLMATNLPQQGFDFNLDMEVMLVGEA